MVTFANNMRQKRRLQGLFLRLKNRKLRNFSTFDFRDLYCFGVRNDRTSSVYVSPHIPNSTAVANYLRTNHQVEAIARRIGNPHERYWIAFSEDFRRQNPAMCAKICLLIALTLNHRINFT